MLIYVDICRRWDLPERRRLVEYLRRFDVGFTYYGGGDHWTEPVPLGVDAAADAGLAVQRQRQLEGQRQLGCVTKTE